MDDTYLIIGGPVPAASTAIEPLGQHSAGHQVADSFHVIKSVFTQYERQVQARYDLNNLQFIIFSSTAHDRTVQYILHIVRNNH